jgi:hypothetical protein
VVSCQGGELSGWQVVREQGVRVVSCQSGELKSDELYGHRGEGYIMRIKR